MHAETAGQKRTKTPPAKPMAAIYVAARDCNMQINGSFYPLKANQRFDRSRDFWLIDLLLKAGAPIYPEGDTTVARCSRCTYTFEFSADDAETARIYIIDADFSIEMRDQTLTFQLGRRLNSATDQWLIEHLIRERCAIRFESEAKIARCPNPKCGHVFSPEKPADPTPPTNPLVLRRG